MTQKPTSRRSKPTRKPVTLDLEATEVKAGKKPAENVHEAEPVALEFGRKTAAETIEATAEKKAATKSPDADSAARGAVENGPGGDAKTAQKAASAGSSGGGKEPPAQGGPRADAATGRPSGGGLAWLGGGVIGGVVALLLAGGLQWAGLLPSMRAAPEPDLSPLQAQIDALAGKIAEIDGAAPELPQDIATGLEAARSATEANAQALAALQERVGALSESISSGDAGEGPGLETLAGRVGDLEAQLAALSASVAGIETAAPGADPAELDAIRSEATRTGEAVAALRDDIAALSGRVAALEGEIETGAGSRVATAIAATALKSAADRGTGFMAELEAYASLGTDEETVAALRDYAASGVPTVAALVERFPAVANSIVDATQGVDEDAGIAERLMASARSLVKVRPVGEVEGEEPGAIAARMEVALSRGDLDAVVAEWEKLPEGPKAASADFMADVRARRELDALLSKVLAGATGPGARETDR
ncbi:COG4223 family protein [Oricola thermophila]|uniref:Phage tail protein n=1 Tax=Oricola thermophila TaxID=2742145 RepID=A0A6N1VKZ7_9HYPH|nr:mitofilin family membrane protein [Oricola thermophila]QKV19889.1 hypothetical protein HTY61_16245 [Oricola thermophila]